MERGQTKTISVSWTPPIDFDVGASDGGQGAFESHRLGRMTALPPPREGAAGGPWAGEVGSAAARKHLSAVPADRGCPSPSPPLPFQPDHPLMVSALLQLRGDVKETYKVLFVARVVTGP